MNKPPIFICYKIIVLLVMVDGMKEEVIKSLLTESFPQLLQKFNDDELYVKKVEDKSFTGPGNLTSLEIKTTFEGKDKIRVSDGHLDFFCYVRAESKQILEAMQLGVQRFAEACILEQYLSEEKCDLIVHLSLVAALVEASDGDFVVLLSAELSPEGYNKDTAFWMTISHDSFVGKLKLFFPNSDFEDKFTTNKDLEDNTADLLMSNPDHVAEALWDCKGPVCKASTEKYILIAIAVEESKSVDDAIKTAIGLYRTPDGVDTNIPNDMRSKITDVAMAVYRLTTEETIVRVVGIYFKLKLELEAINTLVRGNHETDTTEPIKRIFANNADRLLETHKTLNMESTINDVLDSVTQNVTPRDSFDAMKKAAVKARILHSHKLNSHVLLYTGINGDTADIKQAFKKAAKRFEATISKLRALPDSTLLDTAILVANFVEHRRRRVWTVALYVKIKDDTTESRDAFTGLKLQMFCKLTKVFDSLEIPLVETKFVENPKREADAGVFVQNDYTPNNFKGIAETVGTDTSYRIVFVKSTKDDTNVWQHQPNKIHILCGVDVEEETEALRIGTEQIKGDLLIKIPLKMWEEVKSVLLFTQEIHITRFPLKSGKTKIWAVGLKVLLNEKGNQRSTAYWRGLADA